MNYKIMRAKKVYENIEFKRGIDPQKALRIGSRYQLSNELIIKLEEKFPEISNTYLVPLKNIISITILENDFSTGISKIISEWLEENTFLEVIHIKENNSSSGREEYRIIYDFYLE